MQTNNLFGYASNMTAPKIFVAKDGATAAVETPSGALQLLVKDAVSHETVVAATLIAKGNHYFAVGNLTRATLRAPAVGGQSIEVSNGLVLAGSDDQRLVDYWLAPSAPVAAVAPQ